MNNFIFSFSSLKYLIATGYFNLLFIPKYTIPKLPSPINSLVNSYDSSSPELILANVIFLEVNEFKGGKTLNIVLFSILFISKLICIFHFYIY